MQSSSSVHLGGVVGVFFAVRKCPHHPCSHIKLWNDDCRIVAGCMIILLLTRWFIIRRREKAEAATRDSEKALASPTDPAMVQQPWTNRALPPVPRDVHEHEPDDSDLDATPRQSNFFHRSDSNEVEVEHSLSVSTSSYGSVPLLPNGRSNRRMIDIDTELANRPPGSRRQERGARGYVPNFVSAFPVPFHYHQEHSMSHPQPQPPSRETYTQPDEPTTPTYTPSFILPRSPTFSSSSAPL